MKLYILVLCSLSVTSCTTFAKAKFEKEYAACDVQYGFTESVRTQWGEREIPVGWDDWNRCKEKALFKLTEGTPSYPVMLERIGFERMVKVKFKQGQITRSEMNAIMMQKLAELGQKEAKIYEARSNVLMEAGAALMKQPEQQKKTSKTTNCQMVGHMLSCTEW